MGRHSGTVKRARRSVNGLVRRGLCVRLTAEERELVVQGAGRAGVSQSRWLVERAVLRSRMFDRSVVEQARVAVDDVMRDARLLGVLVNDVARVANTDGSVDESWADVSEFASVVVSRVEGLVREVDSRRVEFSDGAGIVQQRSPRQPRLISSPVKDGHRETVKVLLDTDEDVALKVAARIAGVSQSRWIVQAALNDDGGADRALLRAHVDALQLLVRQLVGVGTNVGQIAVAGQSLTGEQRQACTVLQGRVQRVCARLTEVMATWTRYV